MDQDQEINNELKILMVVGGTYNVDAAGRFLTKRNFLTKIVNQVTDAITEIVGFKPDFVFYSISHPNKKVRNLPAFLAQHFNVKCIAFTEEAHSKSLYKLASIKNPYKMMSAPTGPNFLRYIEQIIKEEQGIQTEKDADRVPRGSSEEEKIEGTVNQKPVDEMKNTTISNDLKDSSVMIISSRSSGESHFQRVKNGEVNINSPVDRLTQLGNNEDLKGFEPKQNSLSDEKAIYKDQVPFEKDSFFKNGGIKEDNLAQSEKELIGLLSESLGSLDGLDDDEFSDTSIGEQDQYETSEEHNQRPGDPSSNSEEVDENLKKTVLFDEAQREAELTKQYTSSVLSEATLFDSNQPLRKSTESSNSKGKLTIFENDLTHQRSLNINSEVKKLQKNFLENEVHSEQANRHLLEEIAKSYIVFPVVKAEQSGFLIFVSDSYINKDEVKNAIKIFKNKMQMIAEKSHFNVQLEEGFGVPIYGEFSFDYLTENNFYPIQFFNNEGFRWSIFFLPHNQPIPKVLNVTREGKVEIEVQDVPINFKSPVNLYLFLSKNKKYILYLRKGGHFSEKQKKKLIKLNHPTFIDQKDMDDFKICYITSTIEQSLKTEKLTAA